MKPNRTPDPATHEAAAVRADPGMRRLRLAGAFAATVGILGSPLAHGADGCLVLLCLAAPSWRAIPQCVPPVRQLLRDLAKGRPFPTCAMGGTGNSAEHQWSAAPTNCPPQYTRTIDGPSGPIYRCDYSGSISVTVNGRLFTKTWWGDSGDSVTQFTESAKATLGRWDTRFDDEYADWLARQAAGAIPD